MNMLSRPLHGLLLTGGASRRMGQDKALLDYAGETQLIRAFRLLEAMVDRAFVSVREDQRQEETRRQLPQIVDTQADIGPAAGILAAHAAHPRAAWLVLACDLPLLNRATLDALLAARDPARAATAFTSAYDGLPEPLCAIWEPTAIEALAQSVANGRICPRKELFRLDTKLIAPVDAQALDNANSPEDRDEILARLRKAS
ncbi:NTP transferase domain-containing protein [Dyella sp.]|uniref:NTP transferase domain-containing protein n=1 Tax=Dyella sp. TaxID=1869338 RepID=UPI002ED05C4B